MLVLTDEYLNQYKKEIEQIDLKNKLEKLSQEINLDEVYQTEASAVFSSQIEGNSIDLNSFMNTKLTETKPQTKDYKQILDLIDAYNFAKTSDLNQKKFLQSHKTLRQNLLIEEKQGVYRQEKIGVFGKSGLIYMAVEEEKVQQEMDKLFDEIGIILNQNLTIEEVFYYASLIHLKFVHIHPFTDGNGRAARLFEKWFLAENIGKTAWLIPSEQLYWESRQKYYQNINLGVDYYNLDYSKSLPFLEMLTKF